MELRHIYCEGNKAVEFFSKPFHGKYQSRCNVLDHLPRGLRFVLQHDIIGN